MKCYHIQCIHELSKYERWFQFFSKRWLRRDGNTKSIFIGSYKNPSTCDSLELTQECMEIEESGILDTWDDHGYIFVKTSVLKLEKMLVLFGTGANGKSVFYDILNALLGAENFSSYSLQNLTNDNGYYRAKIGNKLVNYSSEMSSKMENEYFKQLSSGEKTSARLPYGAPI